jgi:16S rRNA pseudouridine516 synthase
VPKVYEVTTEEPVDQRQAQRLLSGVQLDREPHPVRAAACEVTGERSLRLTLTEGKFHQVKRMVTAAGNQVRALHRSRIGRLALPADLAPGRWRWLSAEDLAALQPA